MIFFFQDYPQEFNDNLYALPQTPELELAEESDHFSTVSQMRKSHSVDASYTDDDVGSLHEAVNPKLGAFNSNADKNHMSKSKSEFNLSSGRSVARSGKILNLYSKHKS